VIFFIPLNGILNNKEENHLIGCVCGAIATLVSLVHIGPSCQSNIDDNDWVYFDLSTVGTTQTS